MNQSQRLLALQAICNEVAAGPCTGLFTDGLCACLRCRALALMPVKYVCAACSKEFYPNNKGQMCCSACCANRLRQVNRMTANLSKAP